MLQAPLRNIVQHCPGERHVYVNHGAEQRTCMITAESIEFAAMFVEISDNVVCWNVLRIPSTEHAPIESRQPLIGQVGASVMSNRPSKCCVSQIRIQDYVRLRP